MLTPGNRKLGGDLIWGFALPSGTSDTCPGMTPTCRTHCYAIRYGQYRSSAQAKYERNLELTKLPDFAQRMRYFILHHEAKVVRIHTGGDFYSVRYLRQWLKVMRWLPQVQFFTYTRCWRIPKLKPALDEMAQFPQIRLWYSCDRDTGIPPEVPFSVRLCWLMTHPDDLPSRPVDLVFRIRALRRIPLQQLDGMRVCPDENGHAYSQPPHCETCGTCWRPLRIPPLVTYALPEIACVT
ncbi:MAG: hypothetical protein QM703_27305 [Gemmatales bacterium]